MERCSVWTLALLVGATAVAWAFFAPTRLTLDDVGLFNPVYMYVHTGQMSYPSYGFRPECTFHAMVVHPPTHYLVVALLIKAGIRPPYAESLPPFVFIIWTIVVIARGRFASETKAALLFGFLPASLLVHWHWGPGSFRLVPLHHLCFAWIAGLVTLEAGRIDSWHRPKLFLGAFLLTYASGIHYPASFAWLGCLVYASWAVRSLGWKAARPVVASLSLGGLLFGVPYLLLFVLPHWREIRCMLASAQALGSIRESVGIHLGLAGSLFAAFPQGEIMTLAFRPLAWGVPAVLVSTVTLAVRKDTRGMAAAGLPLVLFVLLFVQRKWSAYLVPEFVLYFCGVCVVFAAMTAALVRRMVPAHGHLATPLLVALFCTIWLTGSVGDGLRAVKLAVRLDERALARAAGRQILGPGALVGARISRFYTNGGDFSYMIEPDLLWNRSARSDLRSYFARFDAIAEDTFMSDATANASKASLSSWYADGTLSLRGFYFSQPNPPVSYLLLRPDPSAAIQGYGLAVVGGREKVLQFRQQSAGDYVFVAAVGPADETGRRQPPTSAVPLLFRVAYRLPAGESGERRETLTLVMRKEDYDRARPALAGYRIRDEVPLAMTLTTPDELLATLKNDEVIEFFLRLRDAAIARNQARRRRREPALRE